MRRCRICGCTEAFPCIASGAGSETCSWVSDDLCSFCAQDLSEEPLVGLYNESDLEDALATMRAQA